MKKLLAVIIAAAALFAAVSCAETSAPPSDDDTAAPSATDTTAEETTADPYDDGLEDKNYDGFEFKVAVAPQNNTAGFKVYIDDSEELSGDLVNDAAYYRNLELEERFNILITAVDDYSGNVASYIQPMVLSDDCDISLVIPTAARAGTADMVNKGMLLNWKQVPHVDFDKPWWNKTSVDSYAIAGYLYFTVSDITINSQHFYFLMFNKTMMDELSLEYPYQTVRDGKWTHDAFRTAIAGASRDFNGDSNMTDADVHGFNAAAAGLNGFMYAYGMTGVSLNDEGMPVARLGEERMQTIVEKVYELMTGDGGWIPSVDQYAIFKDGRALFQLYGSTRELLRDYEVDFGILPLPKLDEAQENYTMAATGGVMGVPITAASGDLDRLGVIIEAMSAGSRKHMYTPIRELYINHKVLRDEESVEMYNIITDNLVFDLSYEIDTSGTIQPFIQNLVAAGSTDAASRWAKSQKAVGKSYEKLFEVAQSAAALEAGN